MYQQYSFKITNKIHFEIIENFTIDLVKLREIYNDGQAKNAF